MSKPIFTVLLPRESRSFEKMNQMSYNVMKALESKFTDYHILVTAADVSCPVFEAFYPKDFDCKDFETFKAEVYANLDSPKEEE